MRTPTALTLSLLLVTAVAATGWARQAPAAPASSTLIIAGDVRQPITFTVTELRTLPRTTVTVQDDNGTVTYEGVLVGELLKRAGATLGADLRGDAVTSYVTFTARDGYRAVFSLAELDPDYTKSTVIVADTADGKPLFGYQGPLRIAAPSDTRGSRSVRMLERIDVARLKR